jgi:carboxyl-terminal processing protease
MEQDEAIRLIRGADGTEVTLGVRSVGQSTAHDVRITRAAVTQPAVQSRLVDGVGHLRIREFPAGTADSVRAELQDFARAGVLGWVIDLRGNRGGDIDEMVSVASLFVGERTVGIQVDRARRQAPMRGTGPAVPQQPSAIALVDGDTGSGAEVLAAALQEYGVATILGTKTAGKVGLATRSQLRDGSVVQLTNRRVLSPSGAPLNDAGVQPDVVVEAGIDDWVQGRDPQLERAVAQLHEISLRASQIGGQE